MRKSFVVVSGLPGSGKTTVARALAPALALPVIDKDDILEDLFEARGIGDMAWRRALSRESDATLQARALEADGALLSSFWHVSGMLQDSGTPIEWLTSPAHRVVMLECRCPADIAAARFLRRRRHPGHLDEGRDATEVVASLTELSALGRPPIEPCLEVDTTKPVPVGELARKLRDLLGRD
ncbi:AAA family ATPase [Ramlibacter sp.]|uniref:AAA family ATPase n=1 Tax=Ramlibacter sp. TaxID=1917967 RepID=UPI003D0F037F